MRRDRPAPVMPSKVLDLFRGKRHNWAGRASPSNGPDSLVSLVTSENLKRVPNWDSVGKYRKSVFSLEVAAWIRISMALRLVQKQLIIYLQKAALTSQCNQ
jgi:hypothetical protein